jgi:hypothetical protein
MAKIARQFVIDSARSIAATGVTPGLEVTQDDGYCFQTVFTGTKTGATGTLQLQVSVDGTNYADYSNGSQNFSDSTTSVLWEVTEKRHTHARVKLSAVSASATGTITTTYCGEVFTE